MSLPVFNRMLARCLAQALKAGEICNKSLVVDCYAAARRDANLQPETPTDPLVLDIQALCIAHDLRVLKANHEELVSLSIEEAEAAILRLLNPDLRI